MKKRVFSLFLVPALLLTALAGCGQEGGSGSSGDDGEEAEQLLGKGCYAVYDEDDELAGYLEVKSSKIIVYSERGREEDTLRYDYNAKKERYTLDDGELFGSGKFTVEKSRKKLKLITEDDDEYTLEEIDKDEIGGLAPSSEAPIGPGPDSVHEGGGGTGDPVLPEGRYYVGGNGSMDLYAWLPAELFYGLEFDYADGYSVASGMYDGPDNDLALNFYALLASGDALQDIIEEAYELYEENDDLYGSVSGRDDLVYGYFRYSLLSALESGYLGPEYLGEDLFYDYYEDVITAGGRDWRYLEIYVALEDGGGATMTLLFRLEDGNMAAVGAGGYGLDPNSSYDVAETIFTIDHSLELYV